MQNSDVRSFCNEEKISIFTTKEPRGASTDGRSLAVIFFDLYLRFQSCSSCKEKFRVMSVRTVRMRKQKAGSVVERRRKATLPAV